MSIGTTMICPLKFKHTSWFLALLGGLGIILLALPPISLFQAISPRYPDIAAYPAATSTYIIEGTDSRTIVFGTQGDFTSFTDNYSAYFEGNGWDRREVYNEYCDETYIFFHKSINGTEFYARLRDNLTSRASTRAYSIEIERFYRISRSCDLN